MDWTAGAIACGREDEEPPRMAPTGWMLTIALTLGDPGLANPFGPLRQPELREIEPAPDVQPPVRQAGGWSVTQPPPMPERLMPERAADRPAPIPDGAGAIPQFPAPEPQARVALQEEAPLHALKLTPPSKSSGDGAEKQKTAGPGRAVTSIASSLAVVLGLFFVVAWLAKRNAPKGAMLLPGEVLEVLGRAPLSARQQMHVVRFGNKLVLLGISPAGAEPLAEIDDPVEVERVLSICQELQQGSITETFRQVFSQFANEPAPEGFAGRESVSPARRE
jgi:flagellar biogenesis protein FliO